MSSTFPSESLQNVDESRKFAFKKLFDTIENHIPKGFEKQIFYGMIGWVVPHSIYPDCYHRSPKQF